LREKLKLNYYTAAVNQFIYLTNIMRAISIALFALVVETPIDQRALPAYFCAPKYENYV